jgi:hypothetical protein
MSECRATHGNGVPRLIWLGLLYGVFMWIWAGTLFHLLIVVPLAWLAGILAWRAANHRANGNLWHKDTSG